MSNLSELLPSGGGQNAVDFVASGTLSSGQTVALKSDGTVEAVTETAVPASVGSAAVFETAACEFKRATFDSLNNKVVIVYADEGNSGYGTAIVGTVSGTSISFGTAVIFYSGDTNEIAITFDTSNNKVVVAYQGSSSYGTAIAGTVSGTSISFGTKVVFEAATSTWISATFNSTSNNVIIAYQDGGNSGYGTVVSGAVSGTSISFGTPLVFEAASSYEITATYDSNSNKAIIAYNDGGNANYGTGIVYTDASTSSNNTDFIGLTAEAISDTATGAVNVYGGINEAQTGLTIGADYYVQDDGSISTTASAVKIGQAISATTINMMDLT